MTSLNFENGYNALKGQIDAAVAAYFSSCVHCGLCAQACLFHEETGDPKYTPIHKVEPLRKVWLREYTLMGRIGAALGLVKAPTDAELTAWEPLVYDSCTMCGRCSLVCPVGNDITYMIRKMREGMSASGHAPKEHYGAAARHLTKGSPMGDLDTAMAKICEKAAAKVDPDFKMDRKGADYMMLISAQEVANFPDVVEATMKIFKAAGVSWTISSKAHEATNIGIQMGNKDVARRIVLNTVEAAEDLGVKYVISPECGHAYQAIRWEGPNLIGRPYKFEVVHIVEVLDALRREGRLKTKGRSADKITFHDPCQLVRRGGLGAEPRRLMKDVAPNFIELPEHGAWGWCCAGGGGAGSIARGHELRIKAFGKKLDQIKAVEPDTVVTICSFCNNTLSEMFDEYDHEQNVIGLTELLAEYLDDGSTEPSAKE